MPQGYSIERLDHVALPYDDPKDEPMVQQFWEQIGMRVTERVVDRNIDNSGTGRRLDVGSVTHTLLVYFPWDWSNGHIRESVGSRLHVAFAVSPSSLHSLLLHHALDRSLGKNGLIRWGTYDASAFLRGPYDVRFEFRCPNFPA